MKIPSIPSNALPSSLVPTRSNKPGSTQLAPGQQSQGELQTGSAQSRSLETLSRRVAGLNDAMTDMAGQLARQFAGLLLGDDAEGASITFDQTSLATQSSFSAFSASRSDANGTQRAAGFRLDDASQFLGHGYITTSDGRRFEFEMEIRYESSQSATVSEQRSNQAIPAGLETGLGAAKPAAANARPFAADFAGTAADLLERLSSEPVRLPFALQGQDEAGRDTLPLLGDLALRLLDLPGGSRYLDLLPEKDPAGRLDLRA
ncbi:hypothetical protein FNU76_20970 [Chitinimonas arctica]|uniref:Uncharacterized protein n=1 Tax=Chitinimonas arctica TaxID=2594795 RepID=A0A516SKE2_9NEIS|nr:hypothetical protein [Chitinimonas arctica]QDQ28625.1 hypothetical protein FNU76_20970 [Chitinimonas arctica]